MDLPMKHLNALEAQAKQNSQSQKLQVQQPVQAPRQSDPNPDPEPDFNSFFNSGFYHKYLDKEANKKRRGGHNVPRNLDPTTSTSTCTSVSTTSHHRNKYHPYSRHESNWQAPPPHQPRPYPDELLRIGNWTGYKNSAQVTTKAKYYDPSKFGSVIPVMPKVQPPEPFYQPSSAVFQGYVNNGIPMQYDPMRYAAAINRYMRPQVSYGLPALPPPPASARPRPPPPSYHQALATLKTQPSNLAPAVNPFLFNNGDDSSDKIEIIDGEEIKLTSNENCCSLSLPLRTNRQRSATIYMYDEEQARLEVLNVRHNIDLLDRVEIRITSRTQAIPGWELFIKQGHPGMQSYVHPIKQTEKDRFLENVKRFFRKIYLENKEKFGCWLSPSERCPHESFCNYNICKVHFKGTEKQRKSQLKQLVDQEFSGNILKFVIKRDFLGVVTDPHNFHLDGYEGDFHGVVTQDTVTKLLDQLMDFDKKHFSF